MEIPEMYTNIHSRHHRYSIRNTTYTNQMLISAPSPLHADVLGMGPIQTRPFSLSIILQREMQIMDFEQIPTFQKIVKSDFDQTCVLYYSGWLLCISHSGMYLAIPLFSKRSPQYCHYAQITMKNAFF